MDDRTYLARLTPYLTDALDKQDLPVRDQLDAALRDGHTTLWAEKIDGTVWLVIMVDGYELARVDLLSVVPLDDLL
jgi:hypothetical protein